MKLKYHKLRETALLLLIIINLQVTYLMQQFSQQINKHDVSNLVKSSDLSAKAKTLPAKAELKAQPDKTVKMQKYDLRYFLGKSFFTYDCSQNIFFISQILMC